MRRVRAVLEEMAESMDFRHQDQDPLVLLLGFGSSSVDWEVSIWTDDPWASRRDLSRLYEATWDALQQAGISIAYPQVDVHLDPPVVEAIAAGPKLVG